MRILLLEPDSILAKVYSEALGEHGHAVVIAHTAQAAITATDTVRPDVVVLEMQLAKHSGPAFLYEFRSYDDWLTIPAIVHTMVPPSRLKAVWPALHELGVVECLYKPRTSLRALVQAVSNVTLAA